MSSESVQATAQRFLGVVRRTSLSMFGRCYPKETIKTNETMKKGLEILAFLACHEPEGTQRMTSQ